MIRTIIELEWIDVASLETTLIFPEDIEMQPPHAWIVGFLFKEDKNNYWIAKELWDTGQGKYLHCVPKKYVIKKRIFQSKRLEK